MRPSELNGLLRVVSSGKAAFRSHVREDDKGSFLRVWEVRCSNDLGQSLDDSFSSEDADIDDVGELGDCNELASWIIKEKDRSSQSQKP